MYAPLARTVPLQAAIKGIVFGLIVRATSYLGLLPALGILRPVTKQPPCHAALLIIAHVVWGSVLGIVTDRIQSEF
ncbi:MAG: hypothetical protein ABIV47_05220 [Roseiflexaceae bacterium]